MDTVTTQTDKSDLKEETDFEQSLL